LNLGFFFVIEPTLFLSTPELKKIDGELYIGGCRYQYYKDLRLNITLEWINRSFSNQNSTYQTVIKNSTNLLKIFSAPYYKMESFLNVGTFQCKINLQSQAIVFFSNTTIIDSLPGIVLFNGITERNIVVLVNELSTV